MALFYAVSGAPFDPVSSGFALLFFGSALVAAYRMGWSDRAKHRGGG